MVKIQNIETIKKVSKEFLNNFTSKGKKFEIPFDNNNKNFVGDVIEISGRRTGKILNGLKRQSSPLKIREQSVRMLKNQAREMEHVPAYLELAKINTDYRFNKAEVTELTKLVKDFVTEDSKMDLVKQLLTIGENNGKSLSFSEIKNFLEAASGYKKQGQENIYTFLKFAKEKLALSDINNPLRLIRYGEGEMLDAVASCDNPKILALIINKIGVNEVLKSCPNAIIKLVSKIQAGNTDLVATLSDLFSPAEIEQITNKFTLKSRKIDVNNLFKELDRCETLNAKRESIIKSLQLENEVHLEKVKYEKSPRIHILPGSFGQGKKR